MISFCPNPNLVDSVNLALKVFMHANKKWASDFAIFYITFSIVNYLHFYLNCFAAMFATGVLSGWEHDLIGWYPVVGNSCGPTDHPNDDIGQAILRLSRSRNDVKKNAIFTNCKAFLPALSYRLQRPLIQVLTMQWERRNTICKSETNQNKLRATMELRHSSVQKYILP